MQGRFIADGLLFEELEGKDALLAYCKQATLAMVRLLEVLYEQTLDRSGRAANMNPSFLL